MKVLLFGASGMVGQGVLRECLLSPDVESVVSVVRRATGTRDAKLHEVVCADLFDLSPIEAELKGLDACFYCAGVSSAGMKEAEYVRLTYTMTMRTAGTLLRLNPAMTFVYVSGAGTDSSEQGRSMWARVKGRTENALLGLGFQSAYMFRPGFIAPVHGVKSKTGWYNAVYVVMRPLTSLLLRFPKIATTTEQMGKAMLSVAKVGYPQRIMESADINAAG